MSSSTIHNIKEVGPRVTALGEKVVRLGALRDKLNADSTKLQTTISTLSQRVETLQKVEELFRALMDLLIVKQVRSIDTVVTDGLQTVFYDQDIHFESTIAPKRGKISVDFAIRRGAEDDPLAIRGKPLAAFGGGPSAIASLILRVLTLLRLKQYPFLVLDEALWAVSNEYIDHTGKFLKILADHMGVQVLMITHKPAYLEHATLAYQGSEEEVHLQVGPEGKDLTQTRLKIGTLGCKT